MQLSTANVENSEIRTLPLRVLSQSHDPAKSTSRAPSSQTSALLDLPLSAVGGQEECQLVANSNVLKHREISTPRGEEKNSSSHGSENPDNDSQERMALPFPDSSVQSTTPEPVLAVKHGPPTTTEDELQFLYSLPTRMNKKRKSDKKDQILEKHISNGCYFHEDSVPGVAKDRVPNIESEVSSTLASTHFQPHIPSTRTKTKPLPTSTTSNRKTQQKEKASKMEANSPRDDGPASLKTKEYSSELQSTTLPIAGEKNAPEHGSQSLSPKTVTRQGIPYSPGAAQIQDHSPMHATSQQNPTSPSKNLGYYQRVADQQQKIYEQYATPQQQIALKQCKLSQPGILQGYGMMQPEGPQSPEHMQPMSHVGDAKKSYSPSSEFECPAQPGSGFRATSALLKPNSLFPPTPPINPPKDLINRPENAANVAPIQVGSYSTDENIQRRPTLYGIPEWQPPSGVAHTTKSADTAVNVPNGSAQYHNPSASNTSQPVDQLASNGVAQEPKKSPNLLVDIALTCQSTFPFELVASRHGVSVKRVMDVFSAVIQIPLLRNASDARRYGKLGSERMKEFRDMIKQTNELAQEVDELNGDVPKAKRGRKRKLVEVVEVQDAGEAPVPETQKRQKVDEKSDIVLGEMAKNGGAAAGT